MLLLASLEAMRGALHSRTLLTGPLAAGCAQYGRPGVYGVPGQVPPHRHLLQVLLGTRPATLPNALQ